MFTNETTLKTENIIIITAFMNRNHFSAYESQLNIFLVDTLVVSVMNETNCNPQNNKLCKNLTL